MLYGSLQKTNNDVFITGECKGECRNLVSEYQKDCQKELDTHPYSGGGHLQVFSGQTPEMNSPVFTGATSDQQIAAEW